MKSFINYVAEEKQDLGTMIRDALKKAGYKVPKDISVRKSRGGYETAYYVDIKKFTINKEDIETIVNKFKSVRYDERSNEILAGGNTFIFVNYDSQMERKEFERIQKFYQEIKEKCILAEGSYVDIGKNLKISIPEGQTEFSLKTNTFEYFYKLNGNLKREIPFMDYTPLWMILLKAGF